jgi:Flp pilus assembly protein TadG
MNTEKSIGVRTITRQQSRRFAVSRRIAARRNEKGYVLVTTAIVLPLLLMCVALATDATYYYARGVELQKIADSAALAGVVRMPRVNDATRIALEVAKRNGTENGINDITVAAAPPVGSNTQLRVTVRDTKFKPLFGSFLTDSWDISRTSTAEYAGNIPLGSVLNAIGTGPMTNDGLAPKPQNFWLNVAGPCAAKENGDQTSSRYDGTSVNSSAEADKYFKLCDWDTSQPVLANLEKTPEERYAIIKQKQDTYDVNDRFPALSINRDYEEDGYNYIVNVPCTPLPSGLIPPAPCNQNEQLGQPLTIQIFDPVFNPDSLRRAGTGGEQIKPDSYGVNFKQLDFATCIPAVLANCRRPFAAGEVAPDKVRVTTHIRVYEADDTPDDYGGDRLVSVPAGRKVTARGDTEVQQFGTCINVTDEWTGNMVDPATGLASGAYATDLDKNYIPDATPGYVGDSRFSVAGDASDTLYPYLQPTESDASCDAAGLKWVDLITIPGTARRGQYRINIRTESSMNSFGNNAFSLRATFPLPFQSCSSINPAVCPSVSGDSSMSVSASVPEVADFFLAQLSPAAKYRNKTVLLQLWDPGEGGDIVEVLRPSEAACPTGDKLMDTIAATGTSPVNFYCGQKFNWTVWNHNVNKFTSAHALNPDGEALGDVCAGTKKKRQTELKVSGRADSLCSSSLSPAMMKSRSGYRDKSVIAPGAAVGSVAAPCEISSASIVKCQAGKFNDRSVAVEIQIPSSYGCVPGTGVGGSTCVETATLPQGGWWKIRYTPLVKSWSTTTPKENVQITDTTTWSVQLVGDPVHIIPNT